MSRFFGREYLEALQEHYPRLFSEGAANVDAELHIGIVDKWSRNIERVGVDGPERFQRLGERPWTSQLSAWLASGAGRSVRHAGVYYAYKGLINFKTAIDLVLYSALIWDLQPRTIIEFGSLQGGSALWFADQLESQCGHGQVHSFELCFKCISPRASHPRLQFHAADLRDTSSVSTELLDTLPHPWLVVDDAHENLANLVPHVAGFMRAGDYFVLEDVFAWHPQRVGEANAAFGADGLAQLFDSLGFVVDTRYTDAFGVNVTASPNGWLVRKTTPTSSHV